MKIFLLFYFKKKFGGFLWPCDKYHLLNVSMFTNLFYGDDTNNIIFVLTLYIYLCVER